MISVDRGEYPGRGKKTRVAGLKSKSTTQIHTLLTADEASVMIEEERIFGWFGGEQMMPWTLMRER